MSNNNESEGLIKTPTQLIVVVVLAFVVPIAAIFTIIHFVVGGEKPRAAVSDKAVAERIKPVGSTPEIEKGPSPLVPAPGPAIITAAVPADGKAAAVAGGNGKAVYEATCKACHDTGAANAPKLGDKTAWAPRLGQGAAGLLASATKGKGAMPAKGGNAALQDADLKAAIDYMIAQAK